MNRTQKMLVLFLPLIFSLGVLAAMPLVLPHWTWSLYDELGWINYYLKDSLWDFIHRDFFMDWRFRPLSEAVVYLKFKIFGFNAALFRFERALELVLFVVCYLKYFLGQRRTPLIPVLLGLVFIVKSPPVLEQWRWATVSELWGMNFLLLALLARPRSMVLSYGFLVLCALNKEPMAVFLALPALLDRKTKEAALGLATTALYFAFLYAGRRGYTAAYGVTINVHSLQELLRQAALDLVPLYLGVAIFCIRRSKTWTPLVFFAFAFIYFALVLFKTWGYTYILAPVILLMGMGLTSLLEGDPSKKPWPPLAVGASVLLILILPLRLVWNGVHVYQRTQQRALLIEALAEQEARPITASNCPMDRRSLGFAADLFRGERDPQGFRADGPTCTGSLLDCCRQARQVAVGDECYDGPGLRAQAQSLNLKKTYENGGWTLFECPVQPAAFFDGSTGSAVSSSSS